MAYKVRTNTAKTASYPTAARHDIDPDNRLSLWAEDGTMVAVYAPGFWSRVTKDVVANVSQE